MRRVPAPTAATAPGQSARCGSWRGVIALLAIVTCLPGTAHAQFVPGRGPFDVIHFVTWEPATGTVHDDTTLRPGATCPPREIFSTPAARLAPEQKLHPLLPVLLAHAPPDSVVQLIVSFRDTVAIPVFPRPDTRKAPTDSSNIAVRAATESLIVAIRAARATQYAQDDSALALAGPDIVRHGSFWLIQALVVEAPLARVQPIADLSIVTSVRPVNAGEPPPVCPPPDAGTNSTCADDIQASIDLIRANDLIGSGYATSWCGVLDTGVMETHDLVHDLFTGATPRISVFRCELNCPPGCGSSATCTDCPAGNPGDPCQAGHGTATASILARNEAAPPNHRGMTLARIQWYSVYDVAACTTLCLPNTPAAALNSCAAVRAFENALRLGAPVIVAQVAGEPTPLDPIGQAARRAYRAGSAVVAAAGDAPTGDPATEPARQATVFAVGARYYNDWNASATYLPPQRYGRVEGRPKPDLLGPTNTETAGNCSNGYFQPFTGTSGATPYVGGAAVMLNQFLADGGATDAGHTYAQLILSGTLSGPFTDVTSGAGLLRLLPRTALSWFGKTILPPGKVREIPLDPHGVPDSDLEALLGALWWPDPGVSLYFPKHVAIRLDLVRADGTVCATSADPQAVFQRASVRASQMGRNGGVVLLQAGKPDRGWPTGSVPSPRVRTSRNFWKLRITNLDNRRCQEVYWTAAALRR